MKQLITSGLVAIVMGACSGSKKNIDASGTFEAVETIVSAEANGLIKRFEVQEGQALEIGAELGYIDTVQLFLKKQQLEAQIKAVLSRRPDTGTQLAALEEQLKQAEHEQKRIVNLVKAEAATQKQLDDINAQVIVLKRQLDAHRSTLGITSGSLNEDTEALKIQIAQIQDQLNKSRIVNPVKGTVLIKYAEVNEMTAAGKPLYKIANLETLLLRAYLSGQQYATVKLGQEVEVLVDGEEGTYRSYPGRVEWISDKAEFTPKTIQTKDERANLVYSVKVRVKNDGLIKIGMYGELKF